MQLFAIIAQCLQPLLINEYMLLYLFLIPLEKIRYIVMKNIFDILFMLFHEIGKLQRKPTNQHTYESSVVRFLQVKVM